MAIRVRPCGDRALLVELADAEERRRVDAVLTARPLPGVVEHLPGARTVLIRGSDSEALSRIAAELSRLDPAVAELERTEASEVVIPVRYDGPDLAQVAERLRIGTDEVIRRHTGQTWVVEFGGFMPGFGYLVGESGGLEVPRRDSPRTRVPAGAVALAGEFSAVYPQASPGGWQLIGSTDLELWDVHLDPPALLTPGTRVRFASTSAERPWSRRVAPCSGSAPASRNNPAPTALLVESPGAQLLIEDLGRAGRARLGVTASGAMDRAALRLANRLLGNPEGVAGLELLFGGAEFRAVADVTLVLTGARAPLWLNGRPVAWGEPLLLRAGQLLTVGRPESGVRCYLGVRGGVAGEDFLDSLSSDPTAGLGPAPLRAGDQIRVGPMPPDSPTAVDVLPSNRLGDIVLPATLGPRNDWFTPAAIETFGRTGWEVTADANRVGVRLHGPALERSRAGELLSEPVVRGSVQVPASGQPIVFGPDHPTTGGYPVIAVVDEYATDRLAQARPGETVRFEVRRSRIHITDQTSSEF